MGITPITNLLPLDVSRSIQAEINLAPMERVENSSRTKDETYSPSHGKSSRGSEGDASEDTSEDPFEASEDASEDDPEVVVDEAGDKLTIEPGIPSQSAPVSFFA